MATILKYGAPFPFGIAVTNPIYSIDPYAGPYENEADALAVFPAALREVGRAIGIYTDTTKRAVKVYNWEKNASNAWVLVPQSGEIYNPSNKAVLDGITSTKVNSWDGKMDKVTENGNIVKVLGLDAENNAKNAEVVDVVGIWDSTTAPTEQELIDNYEGSLFVYAVALTPVMMYVKAGVSWRKVTLSNI